MWAYSNVGALQCGRTPMWAQTATTATAAAAEEFPAASSPPPITHRDEISRSGNPSLRLALGEIYVFSSDMYVLYVKIIRFR